MKTNRLAVRNFIVGCFVLAGLLALAFLSFSIGGLSLEEQETISVYAAFDEIGNLKERAQVAISGVMVGEVAEIVLDEDYRARVRLDIDAALEYPADTSASILTAGLLGDRYILLQLGGDDRLLAHDDEIMFTESALVLERLVGKLIHNTEVDK